MTNLLIAAAFFLMILQVAASIWLHWLDYRDNKAQRQRIDQALEIQNAQNKVSARPYGGRDDVLERMHKGAGGD